MKALRNAAAVARLIAMGAINVVNIKLMKAGIVEALAIAALCYVHHIGLMIGAMIESRLAIAAAAHLAAGLADSPSLILIRRCCWPKTPLPVATSSEAAYMMYRA